MQIVTILGRIGDKMSEFSVPVVPIRLRPHPNADTLSLVDVWGFQVVVKTEEFRGVQLGVFVRPDSIVPATDRWAYLGSSRRIKVRKYKGERSEGVIFPAEPHHKAGDNVMEEYGILKWESSADREEKFTPVKKYPFKWWSWRSWLWWWRIRGDKKQSKKAAPPFNVKKYDVESGRRFPVLVDGEIVVITEKIHGANARFVYSSKTGRLHVGSHTCWKRRGATDWWNAAVDQNEWLEGVCQRNPDVVFYGEVYGRSVQPLDYGKPAGKFGVRLFDIWEPSVGFASWDRIEEHFYRDENIKNNWVPEIYKGVWHEDLISTAEGKTRLGGAKHIREGVVVEPWTPRTSPGIGRVKVKYINPAYYEEKVGEKGQKEFEANR